MISGRMMKKVFFALTAAVCLLVASVTFAAGISGVATQVTGNLSAVAKLITAGAYVAGFAFAVGAIVKFKAHKDNPTQVMISQPITLLFVGAALIFAPSVFKTTGSTMFSGTPTQGTVKGVSGIS